MLNDTITYKLCRFIIKYLKDSNKLTPAETLYILATCRDAIEGGIVTDNTPKTETVQ